MKKFKFNILNIVLIILLLIVPISIGVYTYYDTHDDEAIELNDSSFVFGVKRMYNAFEREFTKIQFDSICKADKISNDLKNWHSLSARDGETKEVIIEYLYIKYENDGEYMYRLIRVNPNKYKITKRIKK